MQETLSISFYPSVRMDECRQPAAKEMTKEKAYLIGVFLGDGSVGKKKIRFTLQTIDRDFAQKTADVLKACAKNKVVMTVLNRKTTANRQVYAVYAADAVMCRELSSITNERKNLPRDFYSWGYDLQRELISGLLDSEGYVSISRAHIYNHKKVFDMKIGIGACDGWITDLYEFLKSKNILVGVLFNEAIKSGKTFKKFIFNKKSFIENGLYFNIARKQDRIEEYKKLFPGSTTTRRIPKTDETRKKMSDYSKTRKRSGGKFVKVMV